MTAKPPSIARVVIDLSLDREFDYSIPANLLGRVHPGTRVIVPFGRGGGAPRKGFVVGLKATSTFGKLKEIADVVGDREQIPPNLLRLAEWIADYYCCPREIAVRAMLPAVVRGGKVKHKEERYACLANPGKKDGDEPRPKLTKKQHHVLEMLRRLGSCPVRELREAADVGDSVIAKLADHGWVVVEKRIVGRDPFGEDHILPTNPLDLTAEQAVALERVNRAVDERQGEAVLLHGVTGSGKTEVYLQAIQRCLDQGLEAIVLVPEISLTPQTCERFRARFGETVSVLHSGLSDGERFDEWTKTSKGETKIAVGARSALFAPFRNVGLIVVDEEHENTYKQDEAPRYNARDVAVVRGKFEKAAVLLGTATPSLESYYNCELKKYALCELTRRVDDGRMPIVEVVDMRAEAAQQGGPQVFSRVLQDAVRGRLDHGEQTILFLNRRGYATQMLCTQCGYVAMCDDCDTAFTYHRREQVLTCHLCGKFMAAPDRCPQCNDEKIRYSGLGTEKVESMAGALFPKATIARMDSDTMTTRNAYRKTLTAFGAGRIQILIGTQMIAKGLHFPSVTLVGVIFADMALNIPDFRASERTFQLITQVAGRAGRGDTLGRVIVQTYTPFHPALLRAADHDFKGFYKDEIPDRKALGFPPASHMAIVHFRGEDEARVRLVAIAFAEALAPALGPEVEMMPAMPSPMPKVRGLYRYQVMLRGGNVVRLSRLLRRLAVEGRRPKGVDIHVDIDPRSLA